MRRQGPTPIHIPFDRLSLRDYDTSSEHDRQRVVRPTFAMRSPHATTDDTIAIVNVRCEMAVPSQSAVDGGSL